MRNFSHIFNIVFSVLCLTCLLPASYITQPSTGGSGYNQIQNQGVNVTQRMTVNFKGAGVTTTDSGGITVVNIPGGGGASIVHAQLVQMHVTGASLTATYDFNVTAGNTLVVGWGWENGANTPSTCADTVGTTLTKLIEQTGSGNANGAIFRGPVNASGADTVICVLPIGGSFEFLYITEYTAASLTTTADGTASVRDVLALQLTTTRAGDTVFCLNHGTSSSGNFSGPLGFQLPIVESGNDSGTFVMSSLIAEVAGTFNVGSATTNNPHWATECGALEGP